MLQGGQILRVLDARTVDFGEVAKEVSAQSKEPAFSI